MNNFSFNAALLDHIKKELHNLDSRKAIKIPDIPTKIIKENIDIFSPFLFAFVNDSICLSNFSHNLNIASVTPTYKKEVRNDNTNYSSVRMLLLNLSKVFKNILYEKIS